MPDAVAAPSAAPSAAPASTPSPDPSAATGASQTPQSAEPKGASTPAPESKPEPRRFKLKVRGAEQEFDEEEVVRAAQRYKAGEDPLREAAETRKQIEAAKAKIRSKDLDTRIEGWRELGYTDEEIAEFSTSVIMRQIEREKADPRDLKIQELEAQQRKAEEARKAEEQKAHEAQTEAQVKAAREHFNKALVPALQKIELPVSEQTIGLTAGILKSLAEGYQAAGVAANIDDLLGEAADIAKQEIGSYVKATVGKLDGPDLVKMLGPEVVEKVRRHLVGQYRASRANGTEQPIRQPQRPTERAPMTQDEWRESLMNG